MDAFVMRKKAMMVYHHGFFFEPLPKGMALRRSDGARAQSEQAREADYLFGCGVVRR